MVSMAANVVAADATTNAPRRNLFDEFVIKSGTMTLPMNGIIGRTHFREKGDNNHPLADALTRRRL
jgi:hypothetical protein